MLVLVASSSDGVVVRGRVLGGVRGVRLGAVVVVVWFGLIVVCGVWDVWGRVLGVRCRGVGGGGVGG